MKINGNKIELNESISLKSYLLNNDYDITKIATELNGSIIPKAEYEKVILKNTDTIEVVSFVGGG